MNLKRAFCATLFVTTAAFAADKPAAAPLDAPKFGTWGVDLSAMDTSVKPGDDFFKYVNGKWAASTQIPADRTSYGTGAVLGELSEKRIHALLDDWSTNKNLKGDEAKVGAVYRTFMDEAAIEKLDRKPIEKHLEMLRNAKTKEDIARFMGRVGLGSSFFGVGISDDAKNPDRYTVYVSQSGLGLPDREFYLQDKFKPQRDRYQQYITDMLRLAGWNEPEKNAADIVAMETKIAAAHWTRSESRDRDKTYNAMTRAELEAAAPGFPWSAAMNEAGLAKVDHVVVRQNTALPKIAKVFADTPLETLQAWEAFRVTDQAAPLLSKRFADTNWEFRSKYMSGTTEQRARWKRGASLVEGTMGETVGRAYVARYFSPEAKAQAEELVSNLRKAMGARIQQLDWMSPETKKSALDKLAHFTVKIGYPSKWRDYSKLNIVEGDLVGNMERAEKFEADRDLARLNQPVDKTEWGMTPQTVNAYYQSTRNEIVFPAAILQPPYFDPKADPAVNYGGIGAVIGHEITHGFDDQGRKSDGTGMLRDWWAPEDAKKFEVQAAKLGAQYEAFNFAELPGLHIIGRQTMGENIGDLGGVLIALEAYHLSLKGKPAPVLDGFTGDQRFFLAFAQGWRSMMRPDALRQQLMTNAHSPSAIRAFAPLRNVDAWYEAFGVKEGEANYVKPEDRVRIW